MMRSAYRLSSQSISILFLSVVLSVALMLASPTLMRAQVLFDLDNAPLHSPLPIDLYVGGINAHFSADPAYYNYSIQRADVLGFTPAGFAGYCIYPSTIYPCDLKVSFDRPLTMASIMYAPEEYATDSSCTMRITGYLGTNFVATNTYQIPEPGTWPTGVLTLNSIQPFDNVVIHYESPPPTGGDYGPIFMADNLTVTTAADATPTPSPMPTPTPTPTQTPTPTPSPTPTPTIPGRALFDFDGDLKTDLSIFRPSVGEWYYENSSSGVTYGCQFGASTDVIASADFTGDGKTDVAFWRPSTGYWYVLRSDDWTYFAFPFGASGDIPVPADFEGDGRADAAVFRPSMGTWFILRSTGGVSSVQFGQSADMPVVSDYDGDGNADIAIVRLASANGGYTRAVTDRCSQRSSALRRTATNPATSPATERAIWHSSGRRPGTGLF